jgi:hypothetical protein
VTAKAIGFYPVESTPEEFAVRIKVELRTVIQAAGIKPD